VRDILGIWGDASDNIPGIFGIGEVGAKKLIAEFGTIENLVANTGKITNEKLREKVEAGKDMALLSKQLASIILDVPLEFREEKLIMEPPDTERLKKLFEELEFRAFGQRVFTWLSTNPFGGTHEQPDVEIFPSASPEPAKKPPETATHQLSMFSSTQNPTTVPPPESDPDSSFQTLETTPHTYHLTDTAEKRAELISLLKKQESVCFDTETTGINTHESELVGMSFSFQPHEAWYVPLPDVYNDSLKIVHEFKSFFEDEKIEKTGQNMKFDLAMLRWYDVEVKGKFFDTMLAHYLLQPDQRHNMDFLAETFLHYKPLSIEALIGKKGQNQLSMRDVEKEVIKEYAAEDADVTFQLRQVLGPMLTATDTLELFDRIEVPLVPILASMEAEGIRLDSSALHDYSAELLREIRVLETGIFEDAGTTFNIASPKQLGEILFDRMKITENPKKTATKQYSTGEDVLTKLLNKHPVIQKILDYRSLTKLKSTYVDVLPTLVSARDGRIHTSYNQAVAATGRLSSNNPNLQNIPIRTEKGREIRKAFVPRNENYVLLSADYSQVELRIIAHLSRDAEMIADFRAGLDIHTATAAKVFGVKLEEVTKEMRRNAKAVNFGIIYGMSAFGLSEWLNIPRKEASEIIRQYFSRFTGIRSFMDHSIESARKNGYVETMMNRRRYLRDINSSNATVRGFAERNAINAPIQGTAADLIKIAMIDIFNELSRRELKSKMILQVHDELVFDVHKNEVDTVRALVEDKMKNAIRLDVPLEVEISTGANWLEAH
jgi:DNA polymerase-1